MAQVDSSMYSQQQAPDILGGISQGMKLSQLATQNKLQQQDLNDKQSVRDAYKGNLTQDANGNMTLNKQGFLSHLAQVNPEKAFEFQKTLAQNERDTQAAQLAQHSQTLGLIGQLAGGITDQASLDATRAKAKQWGLPAEELPEAWNPDTQAHIAALQKSALSTKDQIDTQLKQGGLENEQKKTGIEGRKADIEAEKLKLEREKAFGQGAPAGPITPDMDPAELVRRMVPEKHQAKALEELKDLQNIAKIAPKTFAAFDQAAKEARPATGGLTGTYWPSQVPFFGSETPGQQAFTGLMNTTVKETEGTSRAAAFESIKHNFRPEGGDMDAKVGTRRAALLDYFKSHAAAPTLKAYGIDPTKFNSSNVDLALAKFEADGGNKNQNVAALPIPADQVTDQHVADAQAELARRAAAKNQAKR